MLMSSFGRLFVQVVEVFGHTVVSVYMVSVFVCYRKASRSSWWSWRCCVCPWCWSSSRISSTSSTRRARYVHLSRVICSSYLGSFWCMLFGFWKSSSALGKPYHLNKQHFSMQYCVIFMPPPFEEWWRGIKCYPCPCERACVRPSVRPSVIKIWCPLNNFKDCIDSIQIWYVDI